ncbi:MAG TPA: LAGLIDADG family homing endonuclease [Kofleriaceae bacterium]|nr:LAGLIDADG family homing endonuclease [Kofleriaceae bacterium]
METFSHETFEPWYVTGLIDAAGTFTFSRSGRQLNLYFGFKGSPAFLEILRSFFRNAGKIYGLSTDAAYYRITRNADLVATVLPHFDVYPLVRKREAYAIWREMVVLKQSFRRPDRDSLDRLAQRLSSVRI